MTTAIEKFTAEFSKVPVLKNEEIVRLHEQYKSGDNAAYDKIIRHNIRLVMKIAHEYTGYGLSLEDLIAEGRIGLVQSVDLYDPKKNTKFSYFASFRIRKLIRMALDRSHGVKHGKWYRVKEHDKKNLVTTSLNEKIGDGETEFAESLTDMRFSPAESCEHNDTLKAMMEMLDTALEKREREILRLRFGFDGEPLTLEDIATKMNVSHERIRQIEKLALSKMNAALTEAV